MSALEVVWEDLPPKKRSGGAAAKWRPLLLPLMERPGCWARIAEYESARTARTARMNLRAGRIIVPPGEWEFAARDKRVYARYVGPS